MTDLRLPREEGFISTSNADPNSKTISPENATATATATENKVANFSQNVKGVNLNNGSEIKNKLSKNINPQEEKRSCQSLMEKTFACKTENCSDTKNLISKNSSRIKKQKNPYKKILSLKRSLQNELKGDVRIQHQIKKLDSIGNQLKELENPDQENVISTDVFDKKLMDFAQKLHDLGDHEDEFFALLESDEFISFLESEDHQPTLEQQVAVALHEADVQVVGQEKITLEEEQKQLSLNIESKESELEQLYAKLETLESKSTPQQPNIQNKDLAKMQKENETQKKDTLLEDISHKETELSNLQRKFTINETKIRGPSIDLSTIDPEFLLSDTFIHTAQQYIDLLGGHIPQTLLPWASTQQLHQSHITIEHQAIQEEETIPPSENHTHQGVNSTQSAKQMEDIHERNRENEKTIENLKEEYTKNTLNMREKEGVKKFESIITAMFFKSKQIKEERIQKTFLEELNKLISRLDQRLETTPREPENAVKYHEDPHR